MYSRHSIYIQYNTVGRYVKTEFSSECRDRLHVQFQAWECLYDIYIWTNVLHSAFLIGNTSPGSSFKIQQHVQLLRKVFVYPLFAACFESWQGVTISGHWTYNSVLVLFAVPVSFWSRYRCLDSLSMCAKYYCNESTPLCPSPVRCLSNICFLSVEVFHRFPGVNFQVPVLWSHQCWYTSSTSIVQLYWFNSLLSCSRRFRRHSVATILFLS